MRTLLAGCAVVALFGLTAAKCTPEQVAEVEAYYRASIEAEAAQDASDLAGAVAETTVDTKAQTLDSVDTPTMTNPPPSPVAGPEWDVVADCGGATLTLTGWTDAAGYFKGQHFAILGMGAAPPIGIPLDETGSWSGYVDAGSAAAGAVFGWSLTINGTSLDVTGISDCPA